MSGIIGAGTVLVAAVFAWAGVAKLSSPRRAVAALRGLGTPGPIAPLVAPAECLLAVTLVLQPRWGGLLALCALGAFSGVLAAALRRGERPSCGCFGSIGQQPVSVADLLRNAALAVPAAAVLGGPAATIPTLPAVLTVGAIGVTVGLGVALLRLRLDIGRVWSNELERGLQG